MTETTVPPTDAPLDVNADEARPESPFRWRVANRPDTRFGHAAGGVAGLFVVAAIVSFIVAIDENDPQVAGIVFSILLIVAAIVVGFFVRGPVRSAAITCLVLALPLLWLFAVVGDGDGMQRSDIRTILVLVVVSYVAMYVLTWTRGRAVFLGAALLVAANWLIFEIADQDLPFGFGAAEQLQRGFDGSGRFGVEDNSRTVAIVAVMIAVVLLGAGAILDRRRATGTATPFLVVGSIYAIIGALALGADVENVYATGIFVAIAGLAIGLAGTLGHRRATSWLGAIVLLSGAGTVVIQGTEDSVSGSGGEAVFGGFALVAAALLLVIGVLTARVSGEPIDGGEPIPAKRPEPGPEPEPALVAAAPAATEVAPAPTATEATTETMPVAETPPETGRAPEATSTPGAPSAPETPRTPAASTEAPSAPAPAAPPPVEDEE